MQVTPVTTGPPARASQGPPLEVDRTRERLEQLGLGHAAAALGEELSEAVKHNRAAHLVLDRLLTRTQAWSLFWHPPLARFALLVALFATVALLAPDP